MSQAIEQTLPADDPKGLLSYTVTHFRHIARLNRFAENSAFPHDSNRCLVCHPELVSAAPFSTYLEVVTQSIKERRPSLDASLIDEINGDLALTGGATERVSIESVMAGDPDSALHWKNWLRSALDTGLGLLSVHSKTSMEFILEESEEEGFAEAIEEKVQELMAFQKDRAFP